ncbi:hypothetical protein SAMN02799630_00235 [Paenibacillus sp. UNCCL117]|uniref:ribonuclease H-like domain-containing protein n=1 Tax=unclassified Paenibacillus TaxID=185978 RepID=UPI000890020C|nr:MULTISPECIES: ribonuclease H-like domain-containing protein [unclassified Paenibacillus]SDC47303.1 hypothetical protein SAMN04488602_102296 [Paenibacillus sp. cl123]SFW12154.1 hypothetical protein SAMN02799630_00235 [Paenibacillus sp. UNCCL117]
MSRLRERLNRHLKQADAVVSSSDGELAERLEPQQLSEMQEKTSATASAAEDSPTAVVAPTSGPPSEPSPHADPEDAGWSKLGAALRPGEWGDFVTRRLTYDLEFRHGHYMLGELKASAEALERLLQPQAKSGRGGKHAAREGAVPDTAAERLLFIDTETTGLGQGAGNVPFMIGIGYFENGGFTVEQMLIRHPGEEASMLAYLRTCIAERPILISYNGKSFDWPIVKNRFILNRIPLPPEPEGHIDFLYPSRSLWRTTLASCRLGQVEEDRLGVRREDDVPGSLAPALYFQYLAERDPAILEGVFRHNEWDVLTLVGLAVHFSRLLTGETDFEDVRLFGREEWFRYGRWMERCGLGEAAMVTMEALVDELLMDELLTDTGDAPAASVLPDCVLPLARYLKKNGRYDSASAMWKLYIQRQGSSRLASLEPYIELSMYGEHKLKDLDMALSYAKGAQDVLWRRQALERSSMRQAGVNARPAGSSEEDMDSEEARLLKRIERLERKGRPKGRSAPGSATGPGMRETTGQWADDDIESKGTGRMAATGSQPVRRNRRSERAAVGQQELF